MLNEVKQRCGIYVYLKNMRQEKQIKKIGTVQYISRQQKYVYIYVDQAELDATIIKLNALSFVKDIKVSHINEMPHHYEKLEEIEKDDNLFT